MKKEKNHSTDSAVIGLNTNHANNNNNNNTDTKELPKRNTISDPGIAASPKVNKEKRKNDSKILKDSKGKNARKKPLKTLSKLPAGVVFTSYKKNEFKVISMIGAGGFGEVYRVLETNSNIEYALKTESSRESNKESRLKIEVLVFKAIEKQYEILPERCSHFIRMIDCGMTESMKFMVMTYTGANLEEIRTTILKTDFSFKTALLLSFATLEAIADFHEIGWLHRDIKPSNFVIGKNDKRAVFILDFGMSQKYMKRTDRANRIGKFEGTIRYASRNCHIGHVQWPKDDFESWIYQSIEFFEKKCIPWRRNPDKSAVLNMKRQFFKNQYSSQCFSVCPKEFEAIAKFINDLGNSTVPSDITFIYETLHSVRKNNKIEMDALFDWEETENQQQQHYNKSYRIIQHPSYAKRQPKKSTDSVNLLSERRKRGSTTPVASSRSPDISTRNKKSIRKRNITNEKSKTGRTTAGAKESIDHSFSERTRRKAS